MDATSATPKIGNLTVGNKTYDFPILSGTIGPDVIDIAKLYAQTGMFTYDPGFTSTGSCQSKITYIDGDEGVLLNIAAIRSSSSPKKATSSRPAICCSTANCRPPRRRATSTTASSTTPWSTSRWRVLPRLPPRRPPDGGHGGAVGALAAFYHDSTDITDPEAAHDRLDAHDRENADTGGDGLQIYDRPAFHLSEELALDFAENFLHMCFAVPCEDYKINPVLARAMDKHLHPARRPRAERLDLDRAHRRLVGRQSVRLHRRRHRLPVGPGARRRQRSRAEHARRDRHGRQNSRIHQEGEGQEQRSSG